MYGYFSCFCWISHLISPLFVNLFCTILCKTSTNFRGFALFALVFTLFRVIFWKILGISRHFQDVMQNCINVSVNLFEEISIFWCQEGQKVGTFGHDNYSLWNIIIMSRQLYDSFCHEISNCQVVILLILLSVINNPSAQSLLPYPQGCFTLNYSFQKLSSKVNS